MSIDPVALVVLGWMGGNVTAGAGRYLQDRAYHRLETVFGKAKKKTDDPIDANDRVKAKVFAEAAFTDDDVTLEYLAGVLAASGPQDDAGAAVVAQIGRLSALQLRIHYVFYRELRRLMPNGGANLYSGQDASKLGLVLKGADLFTALGPTHRPDVVGSSLAVLDRERLLSHYELRWDEDSRDKWRDYTVKARPTGQGGKLFLWGHGQRDINAQRMFDTRIALDPFDVPDTPGTLVW